MADLRNQKRLAASQKRRPCCLAASQILARVEQGTRRLPAHIPGGG